MESFESGRLFVVVLFVNYRLAQVRSDHPGTEEGVYPVEEGQKGTFGSGRLRLPSSLDNHGAPLSNPPLPKGSHPVVEGRKAPG